jgi:gamma-glutamyltranspeptidase
VAELVDALDSKSCSGDRVSVRFRPPAPSPKEAEGRSEQAENESRISGGHHLVIATSMAVSLRLAVLFDPSFSALNRTLQHLGMARISWLAEPGWARYLPNGRAPQVGEVFQNKDLGRSLQYMADEERAASGKGRLAGLQAARDAFYRGDLAARFVDYHLAQGGWLRHEDLADYRSDIERATTIDWNGIDVFSCGPWCRGPVLLQILNLIDPDALTTLGHNSAAYVHFLTEAIKLGFSDREKYYGDPRYVTVPLAHLLSRAYANERRRLIDGARAWAGMPPPGEAPRFASYSFPDSFEPHDYFPRRLQVETRIPAEVRVRLQGLGHEVVDWPDWTFRAGAVCTIVEDKKTGILVGGADPRRPGYALGW